MKKTGLIIVIFIVFSLYLSGCSPNSSQDSVLLQGQVSVIGLTGAGAGNEQERITAARGGGKMDADTDRGSVSPADFSDQTTAVSRVHINTAPPGPVVNDPREYIVKFTRSLSEDYINNTILKGKGRVVRKIAGSYTYLLSLSAGNRPQLVNSLKGNRLVKTLEPNYRIYIQGTVHPDDPRYPAQWNLEMLGLPLTWSRFTGSRSVVVAVVDSGILSGHPDLQENLTSGYDFVDDDAVPEDTDPEFSHGTHVAGIIGAATNNGRGIAGVNWRVKIMPIRVIGAGGSGGYSTLISGIYGAVERGADIINLSLAGPVSSDALHEAVRYAVDNGVTVVAASGNHGSPGQPDSVLYPAAYPEVISVGAVGPDGKRAYYSNYGENLDLVAPGGDLSNRSVKYNSILSTAGYQGAAGPEYQYVGAQGTSMAAPHISGLIALLYSAGYTDPYQIKELLIQSTGSAVRSSEYGYGLPDINRILDLDNQNQPAPPDGRIDLSSVRIMARGDNGDKLLVYPDSSGRFSLRVNPGIWEISGLLDLDGNGRLSAGDYYGEATETISGGGLPAGLRLTLKEK